MEPAERPVVSGARGLTTLAPAKVNLGLFVGPLREDGRHELATVMQSISLCDEVSLAPAPAGTLADEVDCAGVAGPNLALAALGAFREATGWDAPPQRIAIVKRDPGRGRVGGGSADAAAVLRLAARAAGLELDRLAAIAAGLGADVPAQLRPGRWLAAGAGERLEPLVAPSGELAALVLPSAGELSTAAVYRECDRLRAPRGQEEIESLRAQLRAALVAGEPLPPRSLLANDLADAALSLHPPIAEALASAREAGADAAIVSGSGPTVVGLFAGQRARDRLHEALELLVGRAPAAVGASAV